MTKLTRAQKATFADDILRLFHKCDLIEATAPTSEAVKLCGLYLSQINAYDRALGILGYDYEVECDEDDKTLSVKIIERS